MGTKPQIVVAADYQLVNRKFYTQRVWKPALRQHTLIGSRSKWLNALELVYNYDGQLYHTSGQPYSHAELTEIFPDNRNRWMGYFLEADETGEAPKRFSREYERLRLIELYCRLVEQEEWAM